MDLMHLASYLTLLFYLFSTLIVESKARSVSDLDTLISTPLDFDHHHIDDEYFVVYPSRSKASKDSLLSRLRRGYYFIDEGQIIPVNPTNLNQNVPAARRRQDNFAGEKVESNKPKKLFVPNLFG